MSLLKTYLYFLFFLLKRIKFIRYFFDDRIYTKILYPLDSKLKKFIKNLSIEFPFNLGYIFVYVCGMCAKVCMYMYICSRRRTIISQNQ